MTDVADLAGLHHGVEGVHRLLDRSVDVDAVDLVEIDVIEAEALEAGVDGGEDVRARQPDLVGPRTHAPAHLGGD